VWAIILIFVGLMFLAFNFVPNFDPWPALARYWPLILIFLGLGKIWDYYEARRHPDEPRPAVSGTTVAWLLLFVLLAAGSWHGRTRYGHHRYEAGQGQVQDTQAIELGGAKSVSASIEMPSGMLTISGNSPRLLDANFSYERPADRPKLDYQVSGDQGELKITAQDENTTHTHIVGVGGDDSDWNLQFGGGVPLELKIEMGAGQSDLRLNGMDVSHLDVEMGAGELNLDLTGERKSSLSGKIEGGAGTATIRLPKDIGVRVQASGGIGSVTAQGLKRDGDTYTNDAYGKTPASIDMSVEGGVGQIRLEME
jgi:N-terminal domain of toast_rack, DUF2154/Domain of unknown function (DUF5668)